MKQVRINIGKIEKDLRDDGIEEGEIETVVSKLNHYKGIMSNDEMRETPDRREMREMLDYISTLYAKYKYPVFERIRRIYA